MTRTADCRLATGDCPCPFQEQIQACILDLSEPEALGEPQRGLKRSTWARSGLSLQPAQQRRTDPLQNSGSGREYPAARVSPA
jgi:hypothetical protein